MLKNAKRLGLTLPGVPPHNVAEYGVPVQAAEYGVPVQAAEYGVPAQAESRGPYSIPGLPAGTQVQAPQPLSDGPEFRQAVPTSKTFHQITPSPVTYDIIVIIQGHSSYDATSVQIPMPYGKLQTTIRSSAPDAPAYNPDWGTSGIEDLSNLFEVFPPGEEKDGRKLIHSPFKSNLFGASFSDLLLGVNQELKEVGNKFATRQNWAKQHALDPRYAAFISCDGNISRTPSVYVNKTYQFYNTDKARKTTPFGNITIYTDGGKNKIHLFEDDIRRNRRFTCTKEDIIHAIGQLYPDYTHVVIIDLGCSEIESGFKGDRDALSHTFGGTRKMKRKRKRTRVRKS